MGLGGYDGSTDAEAYRLVIKLGSPLSEQTLSAPRFPIIRWGVRVGAGRLRLESRGALAQGMEPSWGLRPYLGCFLACLVGNVAAKSARCDWPAIRGLLAEANE